jgi:penicillin-binding protein 2
VGPIGTAAAAHLEGVDFAGKTGTAQVMSHAALARTNKGHDTEPNAWFVGMAPRRNPDIVVAVLWEHGNWGNNSAKLAAQVVDAFVNKQRAKAGNLQKVAQSPMVPAVEVPKAEEAPHVGGVTSAAPAGR